MIEDKIAELRDGLRWGLSTNLDLDDELLEYNLFEQFEPFVWSNLYPANLRPFVTKEGLSEEDYVQLQRLRNIWVENSNLEKSAAEVRRTESPIRAALVIADQLWTRLENRLTIAGRPTETGWSDEDTRPTVLPMR